MTKKYTFTVTATLCEENEDVTREQALESLREWLEAYENILACWAAQSLIRLRLFNSLQA